MTREERGSPMQNSIATVKPRISVRPFPTGEVLLTATIQKHETTKNTVKVLVPSASTYGRWYSLLVDRHTGAAFHTDCLCPAASHSRKCRHLEDATRAAKNAHLLYQAPAARVSEFDKPWTGQRVEEI